MQLHAQLLRLLDFDLKSTKKWTGYILFLSTCHDSPIHGCGVFQVGRLSTRNQKLILQIREKVFFFLKDIAGYQYWSLLSNLNMYPISEITSHEPILPFFGRSCPLPRLVGMVSKKNTIE